MLSEEPSFKVSQLVESLVKDVRVYIQDETSLRKKLERLEREGKTKLSIITDYDATLTDYWVKQGVKQAGGHDIPLSNPLISNQFRLEKVGLENQFAPQVSNPKLSEQEKEQLIEQWFDQVHQLYLKEKLTLSQVETIVSQFDTKFRPGVDQFFSLCKTKQLPLLVVSAGVQNIIELSLQKYNFAYTNLKVRGNLMKFSPQSPHRLESFGPIIHFNNKNKLKVQGDIDLQIFQTKPNCLVLGDSLGDAFMAQPFQLENPIKLGFLTFDAQLDQEKLVSYLKNFDLVFKDNASFDYVNQIIQLAK